MKTAIRLKYEDNWMGNQAPQEKGRYTSHAHYIEKDLERLTVWNPKSPTCDMTRLEILLPEYETKTDNEETILSIPDTKKGLQIFTDGSVKPVKGQTRSGAGFVIYRKDRNIFEKPIPLGTTATINQAELEAIRQAALWVLQTPVRDYDVHIYSDSLSTITKLANSHSSSKQTIETVEILNRLAIINRVKIIKIKAHKGIKGNERADRVANIGAETIIFGPEPIISFNRSHVNRQIENILYNKTVEKINKHNMAENNKETLKMFFSKHKGKLVTQSKKGIRSLTQLLSGQNHLAHNESKRDSLVVPTCRTCKEELDNAEHFLTSCPKHAYLRHCLFGEVYPSMQYMIDKVNPHIIIKYAEESGKMTEDYTYKVDD